MEIKSILKPVWMKAMKISVVFTLCLTSMQVFAEATLITNVNIFDGKSDELAMDQSVLIENNLISQVGNQIEAPEGATVIDGGGKTLMPGLHDMHTHISVFMPVAGMRANIEPWRVPALAQVRAQNMLMQGFTTIRDVGGVAIYLKKNIDAGMTYGPRIFSAEAVISQTGGHGDFRARNDMHPNLVSGGDVGEYDKVFYIADSPDEVRRAARMNLKRGATSLKMFTNGGHTSDFDPLFQEAYTLPELKAGVEVAESHDTYVSTHTFSAEGAQRAIEAGVKDLFHVAYIDEETAKLIAKKGIWTNPGPFEVIFGGVGIEYWKDIAPGTYAKLKNVEKSLADSMKWLVKYDAKMYFGTDLVGDFDAYPERDLTMNNEFHWLSKYVDNLTALKMATSYAAEANMMSGKSHPYQEGPLGVIVEGAYADMLIIDGNPLEDIELMTDPVNNYKLIMKDGVVYKNTLGE